MKIKNIILAAVAAIAVAPTVSCQQEATKDPWEGKLSGDKKLDESYEVGKVLPKWSEGNFDIHAINSGRGECTFMILPDGTSLMIDAGDMYNYKNASYANVTPRPNAETQAYKVYTSYARHFMPSGKNQLDYFILSHYHTDHMGYISSTASQQPAKYEDEYYLVGLTGVYNDIRFKKLIDRSAPDYSEAVTEEYASSAVTNYKQFISYNKTNSGLIVEKAEVGSSDQIVLTGENKASYSNFKVFCYVNSGTYWNGSSIVDNKESGENQLSNGFLFTYGKFDYYTSGDQNSSSLCKAVAKSIGRRIEAVKCLHHMSNPGPIASEMAVFDPRVVITQSFYVRPTIQPHPDVIDANATVRDLFFTNIDSSVYTAEPDRYGQCKAMNGHYVIRVEKGGDSFYVFQLDDTDTSYRIKAIFGPYICN